MKIRRFFVWSLISLISGLARSDICPSKDNESILHSNSLYTYIYRSEALAQAVGTTEDHGKIALECEVHVAHDRACFYNLDLHNCVVTATGGEPGQQTAWIDRQPLPDLSKYPVAIALADGEIKEVKTHDEDPLYYVNIKRGVLSAFVFKLSQTNEEMREKHTDIHGTCPLTSVPLDGTEGAVKTSKDMLLCHFPSRPDWQFSPWSVFWNMSFIQHVINSTTDCEYKINKQDKIIDNVFCKERHAIMLESTHKTTAAVQTNVFYHLDFVKLEVQTSKPAFPILTRRTGIQYEYEHTPVPQSSPRNFLPTAKKMLSDLVLDSLDEIRLFTIPQFTNFVGWIRSSHNLRSLVDSVKDCSFLIGGAQCDQKMKDLAYSYLSDALVQCNNIPCAKTLKYLIMEDNISPTYLNFIFHSWSYMHYSKPGFITNFEDICRLKNSHQCWMSLGSFVRRVYSRNPHPDEKILQEIEEVASYFYHRIAEECEVTDDVDKTYTDCLIFLKVASNMGKNYNKVKSDAVNQFLDIATDEDSPVVVRISALEALKGTSDLDNRDQKHLIYDRLLPLMKNSSLPASIRILSYDQLILVSDDYNFQEHLLNIIKDDRNAEVKHYIAKSLNSLTTDMEFKSKRFLKSLLEMLKENDLSLERILYDTKGKSELSSHGFFLNFPFLPDYMKRFGMKLRDSFIYDSRIYPSIFNQEIIWQLFGMFLPSTKMNAYFEGWEELKLAFRKNLANMNNEPFSLPRLIEALMKTCKEYGILDEGSLRNLDENVMSNLKTLHQLYWEHHKKLQPYAKGYLDLFGSTVKYFVQDNFNTAPGSNGIGNILHSIERNLAEGVTFNTSRVIRVIEAYYQVPTMMGLPLNWTTNATLAFSIRAGLKLQMNHEDNHIHSKGFFQPSAALTFLNRMVLDFPTLTQIGVQANSSGYTSTEFKGQFNSVKGKQTLRFERPSRPLKILELYRTNQLIKHNNYEDIPDWDFERTRAKSCSKEAIGLKFCLDKSYPIVTHRIKPWALMAGWCKWVFNANPTNGENLHYEIEFQESSKQKAREFTTKFIVSEKGREKAASFKAILDESSKDMKLELKTDLTPDFSASLSSTDLSSKKVSGRKIEAALKLFKDFKYEFEYSDEDKIQRSSKTRAPSDENSEKLINEERLTLKTPYGAYVWDKSHYNMGENTKYEASLSYENIKGKSEWMKNVLPPSFWENDKKASVKILLHWKKPIYNGQDTVTRQTEFRVQVPRYLMSLNGNSLQAKGRQLTVVNLAKTDINHGKLDAFLNFTSDYWANGNKKIQMVNITIPRRSWSATFEMGHDVHKYHHEVILKRATMKPLNDLKSEYVGWWSNEVSDRFTVEEREIKLVADHDVEILESAEIADKYSSVALEDLSGLGNQFCLSKIVLYYPLYGKIETVDFDGYFIFSYGDYSFRFQNTFDMTSSYNNLKLTAHSVYRMDKPVSTLYHNSYFTHLTSETKAYNTIHFVYKKKTGQCEDIEFKHDIRSHVFDLSTDAVYKCESNHDGLHTLRLNINTNSTKWSMLDMKLEQIVEDVSPKEFREEVTATHALGTLHVDAEYTRPNYYHQKRVTLCSKDGDCPNAELNFDFSARELSIKFSRQDQYDIEYRREISPDAKNLRIDLNYRNELEGESRVVEFSGDILDRNFHVWKGTFYDIPYHKVKDIITSGYERARNSFIQVANDRNHPLNEMLQPALKMTLYDYWKGLKMELQGFMASSWSEVKEVCYNFDAFAEPVYSVFFNSFTVVKKLCSDTYGKLKEKTVTFWAIDYFHVPYYLQQGFYSLPRGLIELWNQLALGEENALHFKFVTGMIMYMSSFREWPYFEYQPEDWKRLLPLQTKTSLDFKRNEKDKVAMIFGPTHIYTFDGHLYEVPQYPHPDCSLLLAHDVHKSLFTVFSSQKNIHILFPEMSIMINDENEVFVNQSKAPTPLPIQASNGKVTVKREDLLEVWSPSLRIVCRSHDFLCILKLSDFHEGGVIGLLGNADTNPKNDFMFPNGNTSSNLMEFFRTYEVSGKPECKNLQLTSITPASEEEIRVCSKTFEDTCAGQTDIRAKFMEACTSDLKAGHGPCYAAAGLSALCHYKYAQSHSNCNMQKQEKNEIGRNLEVVLVVQETKYLTSAEKSNSPLKGIESLIHAVDGRFRESGYDHIKYSLVGFGGNGIHAMPATHSSQKNIWVNSDAMVENVLNTLEFKSRHEADAIQALKYAVEQLGRDSFGSKVLIIITAKDKQVADKSILKFIQSQLDANGITLYTLSSYPSIEKGKKVFGVRADGLIFPSQAENGEAFLDYPRGDLAKLTSSTRGSVFLVKFLRENKPPGFFTEFAQEVWAKVNKESKKCRSCKNVRGRGWWYQNECSIVLC